MGCGPVAGEVSPAGGVAPPRARLRFKMRITASAAIRQELERRVEEAIAGLSADDQEIIQMKHYRQFSNQEIARILGLSEAATSMRYLRALRRLKAALAPT